MRKVLMRTLLLLVPFFLIICTPNIAYAWQTGGQAGGGGSTGGGTSSLTDGGKNLDSGTYLFELVYRAQGGGVKTLGCAVVYSGSHKGNSVGNIEAKARASSQTNDCKYVTSGALQKLAKRLYDGENLDDIPVISDEDVAKNYIKQFGINIKDLKEEGSDPGNINSYGYRILIQKLTCFGVSGDWCRILYPRKAFANDYPNNLLFGSSWQDDLYTTKDDIGIAAAGYRSWYTSSGTTGLGRAFANYNRGEGYNIIGFNPDIFRKPYDYRPDSLCLNCDDENSNWSHVYSDMANWEGIQDSLESEDSNLLNYFKQNKKIGNNTVACREQIRVKFPDEGNAIRVETGRYFTVGLPQQYSIGAPNFEPLKVERTKECHAYNGDNDVTNSISDGQWQSFWNSDTFYKNATSKSQDSKTESTGTVTLDYNEKNGNGSYNGEKDTDTYNTKVSQNKGTLTVTNSYTLAADTYRYIRKDNGLSVSEVPDVEYTDVGVANFPISFSNTKTDDNTLAATLSFKYTIPKDSSLSKSIGHPNYFNGDTAQTTDEDIYKVANSSNAIGNNYVTKGNLDDYQFNDLKHTACVLEYCDANGQNCKSQFNSCMSNKVKKGKSQTNCSSENYICDINFEDEDTPPDENICRQEGNKYYIGEDEVTKEEYDKVCSCKIENGKYYIDMEEVTEEEYMAVCPPGERVCPDNDPCCLGYCDPCPVGSDDCPGGINVIYRTIDLNTPFPGYSAEKRDTGANWCYYNVASKSLECGSGTYSSQTANEVVNQVIYNNRGVKGNPEMEYQEEPIYELTMDADKIKAIQSYNNDHEYSDFTLRCEEDGTGCKLNSEVKSLLGVSGVCANAKGDRFYTCDE